MLESSHHYEPNMNMSRFSIILLSLVFCLFGSCKKDEEAKQRIADLEAAVASLESDKIGMEADLLALKRYEGGLDAVAAKTLQERKAQLEVEVQKMLMLENQLAGLKQENEQLKTKLAATTMSIAGGGNGSGVPTISRDIERAYVTIEGDHHHGGGFLLAVDDKKYLYTAASTLAGNQKLTIRTQGGTTLTKFGALELSEELDLARLEVLDDVEQCMTMIEVDAEIPASTSVLLLGHAKGSRKVVLEKSSITSTDAHALLLDNTYLKTAPGGPVIHALSGKVLGVMGHVPPKPPELWQQSYEQQTEPQLLVARLNRSIEWKGSRIGTFLMERKRLQDLDDATRLALAVASVRVSEGLPQLDAMVDGAGSDIMSVFKSHPNHSMVQILVKWKTDQEGKKFVMSEADAKKKLRGVLSEALSLMQRGFQDTKPAQFSWYHRAWASSSVDKCKAAFEKINAELTTVR
ncbi:MAG: hypothetical protein RLZZ224_1192 [Verrucomicrobiota bacterium]